MSQDIVIIAGLFILAFVSGMLGLGVAFAAIPFFGLFYSDLIHDVQPLSLILNGVTALFSVIGFAKSGFIDWKKAIILATITTLFAPIGSYFVQYLDQKYVWFIYFASVLYLAYGLFKPVKHTAAVENFTAAVFLAIPISILSGFLGVGPGFLLMPSLIVLGFEPKKAAGINAFAVCPPSFSALIPHIPTAHWNIQMTVILVIVGSISSFFGARLTSRYVSNERIKQLFGILIVVTTVYKLYTLLR